MRMLEFRGGRRAASVRQRGAGSALGAGEVGIEPCRVSGGLGLGLVLLNELLGVLAGVEGRIELATL